MTDELSSYDNHPADLGSETLKWKTTGIKCPSAKIS